MALTGQALGVLLLRNMLKVTMLEYFRYLIIFKNKFNHEL
jgi:hypothetical protein